MASSVSSTVVMWRNRDSWRKNKITIEKNRYPKNKKNNDSWLSPWESLEFQLSPWARFVTSNYLFIITKYPESSFPTYLPPIIESDSFSSLNFELPYFLKTLLLLLRYFVVLSEAKHRRFLSLWEVYNAMCFYTGFLSKSEFRRWADPIVEFAQ